MVDLIYPRRCPVCHKIVIPKNDLCCKMCYFKLDFIDGPRCMKCSKPVHNQSIEYCFDCSKKKKTFERGYALWVYDDIMRESIAHFKYKGKKEYAKFYATMLFTKFQREISDLNIDALIPVPIHKKKKNIRGYNQATVIANILAELLDIPVIDNVLTREIYTTPQKELNDSQRRKNMEKAFLIKDKSYFYNKNINNILIIDDIYTTGSTIEYCTRKLKQEGAKKVYFLCVCIGLGK